MNRTGIDITNIRLDLAQDMEAPTLEATETIDFTPLGWPTEEFKLSARGLKIASVSTGDPSSKRLVKFSQSEDSLTVSLEKAIPVGSTAHLVISYSVVGLGSRGAWTPTAAAPNGQAAQLNTAFLDSWYVRGDVDDRFTSDITVDVPMGYVVCAPGRLASRTKTMAHGTPSNPGKGGVGPREVFRWTQDAKAGGDLGGRLDLAVGKFDVVEVGDATRSVLVYAPLGRGAEARSAFAGTARAIDVLAGRFGSKYPWLKHAFVLCAIPAPATSGETIENAGWDGSEVSASMTFLPDTVLGGPVRSAGSDPSPNTVAAVRSALIARSLARQWFGALISQRSESACWLDQGLSTYAAVLAVEGDRLASREGVDTALVEACFELAIADAAPGSRDAPSSPRSAGMVSNIFDRARPVIDRAADPRAKGAAIVHMLRRRLGDDVFFKGIAKYVSDSAHRSVQTIDFRRAMEEASGESLELFFDQWCDRPGVPSLSLATSWNPGTKELEVRVSQTQNIDADNPAFTLSLPLWIPGGGTGGRTLVVEANTKETAMSFPLDAEPAFVAADPWHAVLASIDQAQSAASWAAQRTEGPTVAARERAEAAMRAQRSGNADPAQDGADATALRLIRTGFARALRVSRQQGDHR